MSIKFWAVSSITALLVPAFYVLVAFLPLYLHNRTAQPLTWVNNVISLLFVCRNSSGFFTLLLNYCGHRITAQVLCSLGVTVLLLLVQHTVLLVVGVGLMFAVIEPNSFALLSYLVDDRTASHATRATGFGIHMATAVALIGVSLMSGFYNHAAPEDLDCADPDHDDLAFLPGSLAVVTVLCSVLLTGVALADCRSDRLLSRSRVSLIQREADERPFLAGLHLGQRGSFTDSA